MLDQRRVTLGEPGVTPGEPGVTVDKRDVTIGGPGVAVGEPGAAGVVGGRAPAEATSPRRVGREGCARSWRVWREPSEERARRMEDRAHPSRPTGPDHVTAGEHRVTVGEHRVTVGGPGVGVGVGG